MASEKELQKVDDGVRLLRYGPAGHERPGLLDAEGIIRDLSGILDDITPDSLSRESIARLKAMDPTSLHAVAGSPRFGVPIKGIRKIIAIGLNYREHAAEARQEVPKEPVVFMKAITALCGPDDDVIRPKDSVSLDHEVELVIVIGKRAQYITEDEAAGYIAGYATGHDVSERDFQARRGGQWVKGKSADTFAPLGPFVLAGSSLDATNLDLWLAVNGEERQRSNTREMVFKPHFLVSYLSQFMTLEAGDVIYSGTPSGVGLGRKPPLYLKPGDVVTLGVEHLGVQRQKIVDWSEKKVAGG
jgi:2,4-didehydro-3-deoxy-L-rhamnonate hydrolase